MRTCEREQEVLRALRAGAWTDALRSHASGCEACAETERVARALLTGVHTIQEGMRVPGADAVWLRAQSRAREAALRRATRPLLWMRALSIACLAVVAVWMAAQFQGALAGQFAAMGGWALLTAGLSVSMVWLAALLSLAAAGMAGLWYAAHRTDAQDRRMTT